MQKAALKEGPRIVGGERDQRVVIGQRRLGVALRQMRGGAVHQRGALLRIGLSAAL